MAIASITRRRLRVLGRALSSKGGHPGGFREFCRQPFAQRDSASEASEDNRVNTRLWTEWSIWIQPSTLKSVCGKILKILRRVWLAIACSDRADMVGQEGSMCRRSMAESSPSCQPSSIRMLLTYLDREDNLFSWVYKRRQEGEIKRYPPRVTERWWQEVIRMQNRDSGGSGALNGRPEECSESRYDDVIPMLTPPSNIPIPSRQTDASFDGNSSFSGHHQRAVVKRRRSSSPASTQRHKSSGMRKTCPRAMGPGRESERHRTQIHRQADEPRTEARLFFSRSFPEAEVGGCLYHDPPHPRHQLAGRGERCRYLPT